MCVCVFGWLAGWLIGWLIYFLACGQNGEALPWCVVDIAELWRVWPGRSCKRRQHEADMLAEVVQKTAQCNCSPRQLPHIPNNPAYGQQS